MIKLLHSKITLEQHILKTDKTNILFFAISYFMDSKNIGYSKIVIDNEKYQIYFEQFYPLEYLKNSTRNGIGTQCYYLTVKLLLNTLQNSKNYNLIFENNRYSDEFKALLLSMNITSTIALPSAYSKIKQKLNITFEDS